MASSLTKLYNNINNNKNTQFIKKNNNKKVEIRRTIADNLDLNMS